MSHADVSAQLHKMNITEPLHSEPIGNVVMSVIRKYITEMDGRDMVRCMATERVCDVDVYTVSLEEAAVYRPDRHYHGNFSNRSFASSFRVFARNFQQIVLDYFWIPNGWDMDHWRRPFFEKTLVDFVTYNIVESRDPQALGKVYLPFTLHCFREVLACRKKLLKVYNVSFLRKHELHEITLWRGTQAIDPRIMQFVLGKRKDQEECYCTFGPREVRGAMEDPTTPKDVTIFYAKRLEDFADIRFIALEPICSKVTGVKRGKIIGLKNVNQVKNGFGQVEFRPSVQESKIERNLFTQPDFLGEVLASGFFSPLPSPSTTPVSSPVCPKPRTTAGKARKGVKKIRKDAKKALRRSPTTVMVHKIDDGARHDRAFNRDVIRAQAYSSAVPEGEESEVRPRRVDDENIAPPSAAERLPRCLMGLF